MERDEARRLRAEGHTLAAIAEMAGVSPVTVGRWCSGVVAPPGRGARDTQRRHREAAGAVFEQGRWEALELAGNPLWVAGTTMYWGEGTKAGQLGLANSDPNALRLFASWVRGFHDERAEFEMRLHLHDNHLEEEAVCWWKHEMGFDTALGKTFWKPAGTGHRKNSLTHGVCTLRVRRSSLMLHRTLGWIEGLAIALPLPRPAA